MKSPKSLFFKSAIIFIFFFLVFLSGHLLSSGFTSIDDPYYHAKHAFLIEQSGNLTLLEPWIEFNFLNYAPTDPWWGFHLGMALFIHWFGLMLGVKIFISFLAALVFLVFYLILDNLKIKYPAVWTFCLLFSSSIFTYRMFLERPHLLSMIILPLAFLLMLRGKNFWLFILSVFYVLCYHLASLIIFQALVYIVAEAYINKRVNLRPLIFTAGGFLAGIIIHPASLNYIYLMFTALGHFFMKFSGVNLSLAGEMQPIEFFDFVAVNFLVLLFFILTVALFLSQRKSNKNSVIRNFLFLYSSLWFVVTLSIPRAVEYWLPATFLFAAVIFNDFIKTEEFRTIKDVLNRKINLKIITLIFIGVFVLAILFNLSQIFLLLNSSKIGDLGQSYEQANGWLKANTEKGSVIFYDNWGMWPMMFFYNNYNRYVIGIEPVSTYEYNEQIYWLWHNISREGIYCDRSGPCLELTPADQIKLVPLAIKSIFYAQYVIVFNHKTNYLIKTLNNLHLEAQVVYKNRDLLIYKIK